MNANGDIIVRAPRSCPQSRIDDAIASSGEWIERAQKSLSSKHHIAVTPQLTQELKSRAPEVIFKRVEHFSRLTGLEPSAMKITTAKTRLGSCSGKNSLCFSCYLLLYPENVIDYTVLHELAHIRHKNHGREFYALIERYMPDYRDAVAAMKGIILDYN